MKWLLLFVSLCLASCSSGGGGGSKAANDNFISTATRDIRMTVAPNSFGETFVSFRYKGDGIIAGVVPGQSVPSWLSISEESISSSSATFLIGVYGDQVGTHEVTLRFVTGDIEREIVKYVDIPLTLVVEPPLTALQTWDFDQSVAFGTQAYTLGEIQITGPEEAWTLTAGVPWLSLSKETGTGPDTVTVILDPSLIENDGLSEGYIDLVKTQGGYMTWQGHARVEFRPGEFQVLPQQLTILVDESTSAGALDNHVTITHESGAQAQEEYSWQVWSISESWVSLNPAQGTTAIPTDVQIEINPGFLKTAAAEVHNVEIQIEYHDEAGDQKFKFIYLQLDMRLPGVTSIMPSVATMGQDGTAFVKGTGLDQLDLSFINQWGFESYEASLVDNETIQLTYQNPQLEGDFAFPLVNLSGIDRSVGQLSVLPSTIRPLQTIPLSAQNTRLLWDARRQRLFAVQRYQNTALQIQLVNGQWEVTDGPSVDALVDLALSPDGDTMLAVSSCAVYTSDTRQDGWDFTLKRDMTELNNCWVNFLGAEVINDNKAYVSGDDYYSFDFASGLLVMSAVTDRLDRNTSFAPATGEYLFGTAGYQSAIWYPGFADPQPLSEQTFLHVNSSVSYLGNFIFTSDGGVYNKDFTQLGTLYHNSRVATDSQEMYAYSVIHDEEDQLVLEVRDLAAISIIGEEVPLLRRIPLPSDSLVETTSQFGEQPYINLIISDDGNTAFIAGNKNLFIVDISENE